jgi:hypothetical protein
VVKQANKANSQVVQLATELRAAQKAASRLGRELEAIRNNNEGQVASSDALKAQITVVMGCAQRNLEPVLGLAVEPLSSAWIHGPTTIQEELISAISWKPSF